MATYDTNAMCDANKHTIPTLGSLIAKLHRDQYSTIILNTYAAYDTNIVCYDANTKHCKKHHLMKAAPKSNDRDTY